MRRGLGGRGASGRARPAPAAGGRAAAAWASPGPAIGSPSPSQAPFLCLRGEERAFKIKTNQGSETFWLAVPLAGSPSQPPRLPARALGWSGASWWPMAGRGEGGRLRGRSTWAVAAVNPDLPAWRPVSPACWGRVRG